MILRLRCRSSAALSLFISKPALRLAPLYRPRYLSSTPSLKKQAQTPSLPSAPTSGSSEHSNSSSSESNETPVSPRSEPVPEIDHTSNRYAATLKLMNVSEGVKIMQIGRNAEWAEDQKQIAAKTGMNVVAQYALPEGEFQADGLKEAIQTHLPYVVSLASTLTKGDVAPTIKTCMEQLVPVVVSHKFLNAGQSKEQSMTRLIGPGCKLFVLPHAGVYLAEQQTRDMDGFRFHRYSKGSIGVISYQQSPYAVSRLVRHIKNQSPDAGFAAVVSLDRHEKGGTRIWEILQWMLSNSGIEAHSATLNTYKQYLSSRPSNERSVPVFATGLKLPHEEQRAADWKEAGMTITDSQEEMVEKLLGSLKKMEESKRDAAELLGKKVEDVDVTDIKPEAV